MNTTSEDHQNLPSDAHAAQHQPLYLGRWLFAVFASLLIGWIGYRYAPIEWEIPERLQTVTSFSPPELQKELDVAKTTKRFGNYLTKLAFLGLCFGGAVIASKSFRPKLVALSIAGGTLIGLIGGIGGYVVFEYLEKSQTLPGIDESLRPLVSDVIAFTSLTVPLMIAFSIPFSALNRRKWDPVPFVLYGVVVGILVPFIMSIAFPDIRLDSAPPEGEFVIPVWLGSIGAALLLHALLESRKSSKTATLANA
jgi:hypothetical protein